MFVENQTADEEREINDDCGVKQTGFVFGVFDFYIYDGNDFSFLFFTKMSQALSEDAA